MKRVWKVPVLMLAIALASVAGVAAESLSGKLTVAGSTSVYPFMELLAEAFMAKNPQVQINVQGGGSSAGVKATLSGTCDIGMASRELKDQEIKDGVVPTVIARDGIAVIANKSNKVTGATIAQIRDIFAGKLTGWEALKGKGKILVVNREEGSGTRLAFEEIVMGSTPLTKDSVVQSATGAVITAVAGDPNAIGYVSLANVDKSVKALKVEGADASVKNILNGTYKIARPFNVLTKGRPQGLAKTFIDFILSKEGQKILADNGLVVKK